MNAKRIILVSCAVAIGVIRIARATATLTTLVTFNNTNGATPEAGLISDAAGNLYGTASYGGSSGNNGAGWGTVFEIAAGTNTLSTLTTFNDTNGAYPHADLVADAAGNLYGTTPDGGSSRRGTVFEVAAGTHMLSTLVTFNGTNGENPYASLVPDAAGNLYGTTLDGGENGDGTVFEIAAVTHTLSTIATFNSTNGANPGAGLVADAAGNLYGTTEYGGSTGNSGEGWGTVFEIAAGSHTLTTLATFNGTNEATPTAGLTAAAGNLYGTTLAGGSSGNDGAGWGTVFEVAAGTNTLSTLAAFNNTDGAGPTTSLIADAAGNLYGTTQFGGSSGNNGAGWGTVFEIAAGTNTLSTLATFNNTNGASPEGTLFADGLGNLYGTTEGGGEDGDGTVFELTNTGFVVPEPTSLSLLSLIVPALLTRRRSNRIRRLRSTQTQLIERNQ